MFEARKKTVVVRVQTVEVEKASSIDQKEETYKSAVESCHKPTEVLRKKPKNLSELRFMDKSKKKPNRRILESRKKSRKTSKMVENSSRMR
ncbi:hypothetical protein B9Z55_027654 [Caenorhabditis nigoni]|uniref:Uncharacterized protein n=1 Tax=Caenorhabditis nigoni TaxID=1611254 RepID=A0A2G5SEQ1_9PELO|nr:hypothetical protein B9Z55_027654 [Caenorhabditis nigoni]